METHARSLPSRARKAIGRIRMSRRNALRDYQRFLELYDTLSTNSGIDPNKLLSRARGITLTELRNGITAGDLFYLLVDCYLRLPNICDPRIPTGTNGGHNLVLKTWGAPNPRLPRKPLRYDELGLSMGFFVPSVSARVSAPGFPFLFGSAAALDRAVVNLMIDTHVASGYLEILAPTVVNERSMFMNGAFPEFASRSFHVEGTDLYLNPTIEIQQTNLFRNFHLRGGLPEPIRLVGYSRSFRIEDYDRYTTYTVLHEFGKVEAFSLLRPEQWWEEYERYLYRIELMLQSLELPFRKVLLTTQTMGLAGHYVSDFEVYAPGSDQWWEVTSVISQIRLLLSLNEHNIFRSAPLRAVPFYVTCAFFRNTQTT